MGIFGEMWMDYEAEAQHPNGTTIAINAVEKISPVRMDCLSIEIYIPAELVPRNRREVPAFAAKTMREIADAMETAGGLKPAIKQKALPGKRKRAK